MKIIDSHMHLGLENFDADRIIREMDRKKVDQSWLLSWEELEPPVPELHLDLPVEALLEAAEAYPGRLLPFYAPDPSRENVTEHFKNFLLKGIRGCAELKVSLDWDDILLDSYLTLIDQHKLPLVFHMEDAYPYYRKKNKSRPEWVFERLINDKYNGVSRYYLERFASSTGIFRKKIEENRVNFPGILGSFSALEKRISEFPGIRFIGHGPHFWNNISSTLHPKYIHQKGDIAEFGIIDGLLERYDNFYCDLSGTSGFNAMNRDKDKSKLFLQKHASKLLYGTDNTSFPLLELIESLNPGKENTGAILSGNALKVLDFS